MQNTEWLKGATEKLRASGITSARLDAELLLGDVLNVDRSWLVAHGEESMSQNKLKILEKNLQRRCNHEPLAYIRGWIEFYGRKFKVAPDVMIPRPETEVLIELLLKLVLPEAPRIHDVGTGSGCIAITAALELPNASVSASDISPAAVEVAKFNAKNLGAKIPIRTDDLMKSHYTTGGLDVITANLPYVRAGYEVSPEAHFEPSLALYADNEGYELIERLLPQAARSLLAGGYLLLESDPWQQKRILELAKNLEFKLAKQTKFHLVLQKIMLA